MERQCFSGVLLPSAAWLLQLTDKHTHKFTLGNIGLTAAGETEERIPTMDSCVYRNSQ